VHPAAQNRPLLSLRVILLGGDIKNPLLISIGKNRAFGMLNNVNGLTVGPAAAGNAGERSTGGENG
jgi:hypothetical protein